MIMNVIRPIRASLGGDLPTGVFETSISFRNLVHITSKIEKKFLVERVFEGFKIEFV